MREWQLTCYFWVDLCWLPKVCCLLLSFLLKIFFLWNENFWFSCVFSFLFGSPIFLFSTLDVIWDGMSYEVQGCPLLLQVPCILFMGLLCDCYHCVLSPIQFITCSFLLHFRYQNNKIIPYCFWYYHFNHAIKQKECISICINFHVSIINIKQAICHSSRHWGVGFCYNIWGSIP